METMSNNEIKAAALKMLRDKLPEIEKRLREVDERLWYYLAHVARHSSADPDDEDDVHNTYEVLGALKFLRMMDTYELDVAWVQKIYRMFEGCWQKHGNTWRYVDGSAGLMQTSLEGWKRYMLQPFQLFILTWIFGFYHTVQTGSVDTITGELPRPLLESEHLDDEGRIMDRRRLVTEAVVFIPRKAAKTTLSAFIQFVIFFFGDVDAEIYCAANAAEQSDILFRKLKGFIHQLDPNEKRINFTAKEVRWKDGQMRQSKVKALTAGGKTKDGLNPASVGSDEYGSASFTNGRSDMVDLLNVLQSGMGVRREPLIVHTTTASNVMDGPFSLKLAGIKKELEREISGNGGIDYQASLILCPDEWELDEEILLTSQKVWRKVNPMVGISVQSGFYAVEAGKARLDPNTKKEFISKLCNVYDSDRVKDWIKWEQVVRLQKPMRIIDCQYADGWDVFVGLDFSSGQDLFAITYLGVKRRNPSPVMSDNFFADTEAWIIESELQRSPNHHLYEQWISSGWLKVCPGKVFNPSLAIDELMNKSNMGVNLLMFGYDPAQSKFPINDIKAWLQSIFTQRGLSVMEITNAIKDMVVPVAQNYMTMNPIVGELEYMMLSPEPWLRFSNSPLWPWCFQNVFISESKDKLRKPLKGGGTSSTEGKVDPVHALCDAVYCFDLSEGKING